MSKTSASAVSARLRKAGFAIVADRKREGIRVSRSVLGEVHIVVDLDIDRQAKRLADLVHEELKTWEGYEVRRTLAYHFYLKKAGPKQVEIVDLLAQHQPAEATWTISEDPHRANVRCLGCDFIASADDRGTNEKTYAETRRQFAAHQAKILRGVATITPK